MADFSNLDVEAFRKKLQLELQQTKSRLMDTTTPEMMVKGETAYWPIITANGEMSTRAGNGEFAFDNQVHTRVASVMAFKALKDQITDEDLQTSQTDPKPATIESQKAKVNYTIDQTILTAMDATTETYTLPSGYITFPDVRALTAQIYENNVPDDDEIYCVLSPQAWAQMEGFEEFTSGDYVNGKPLEGGPGRRTWKGVTWIRHSNVSGVGTSAAKCFMWAKSCVGHAMPADMMGQEVTRDPMGNFRWIVASKLYHGAKVIQNGGVIEFSHNDTAAQAA